MREATKEEQESVTRYVESISEPTGIKFYDILDLHAYKFKTYLGSVSRYMQNRRLKNIAYKGDNI